MAITITDDELAACVQRRVDELLSPERVEALAEQRIEERVGSLTLAQAEAHLQVKPHPQHRWLRAVCRKYGIPITKLGRKIEFIRLAEIEAAQKRHALQPKKRRPSPNPEALAA